MYAVVSCASIACGGTLNAGWDEPRGLLPVDGRNTIVLCNDGPSDNWQGEYAMLLAGTGGPPLAGIVVTTGGNWMDLAENLSGWRAMADAARASGLSGIPEPSASEGSALVRPSDDDIDATVPNQSAGAQLILDAADRYAEPNRPLVVATGGRLTELADAYLMDPTLPDRVVVVASLGSAASDGGLMGVPNGEYDTWADVIVAQKFRYVQVGAFYDQLTDVPASRLSELPDNAFGSWIAAKQPSVWANLLAADQVSVLAVALPEFATSVVRVAQRGTGTDGYPALVEDSAGPAWLVTEVDGDVATARLWEVLLDPATFGAD